MAVQDHHTQSNYKQLQTTHADYDLGVDMGGKRLHGYCTLSLDCLQQGTDTVTLDTRGLKIYNVELLEHKALPAASLRWKLGEVDAVLGQALVADLPGTCDLGDTLSIGVSFETDESSTAVQFLEPQQTTGKEHPFLFTQCQAIHARALVPCQDTPSVKMTYTASVTVQQPLRALMSAQTVDDGPEARKSRFSDTLDGPTSTYQFKQDIPVPSYLIALAVGALQSQRIGPRSRVWAEPPVLEAAAWEFAETEQYLAAAEAVAGEPYMWGQYDLLVLPPSFPYGGMENPCLTFVTPTLITGDRSATNVVAHEIAHSWTGNWVTNATWEHFWLNEGFTVFFERKIIGHVFGKKVEQFHAMRGLDALKATVADFGGEHPYTKLVPSLAGVDPDDSFSRIPYEKGFYFLYHLQDLVGVEDFTKFTAEYLAKFGKRTATTDAFKALVLQHFKGNSAIQSVDWQKWLHEAGMPPDVNQYDNTLMEAAEALAERWHHADPDRSGTLPESVSESDVAGWTPDTLAAFASKLGQLTADKPLPATSTRTIGSTYKLDSVRNPEVRLAWLKVCIAAEDVAVLDDALAFAREQGRMKFVRPLYKALYNSRMGSERALTQFKNLQDTYHPIARKMVAADLQGQ